jgi:hypothetical protein
LLVPYAPSSTLNLDLLRKNYLGHPGSDSPQSNNLAARLVGYSTAASPTHIPTDRSKPGWQLPPRPGRLAPRREEIDEIESRTYDYCPGFSFKHPRYFRRPMWSLSDSSIAQELSFEGQRSQTDEATSRCDGGRQGSQIEGPAYLQIWRSSMAP